MTNQQTPKSRSRRLIRNHMEKPGHTLEDLYVDVAREIEEAERRGEELKAALAELRATRLAGPTLIAATVIAFGLGFALTFAAF